MLTMAAATSTSTSPTPSDSTSVSDSAKSLLTEPVRKCLRALEAAATDTEKFATLFLVPKLVRGTDCDRTARLYLMKGIGYSFLARMLRSKDSPDGCPKLMFQSVALSVLSCFTGDEEIMTHPSVLFNLPILLDIINDADNELYEENLLIVTDAYYCLTAIVGFDKGRLAFISNRGVHVLCDIVTRQTFQHEESLKLLLGILASGGHICWNYHQAAKDFNCLMLKLCSDFSDAKDESKFLLCDTIRTVLRSFPKSSYGVDDLDAQAWLAKAQKGLQDVLFSKIVKCQRDPAIMLVASVIEVSDFVWCLKEDAETNEKGKFFLIVVNLACIEVIMHLEDSPASLEDVVSNSELLVACYYIIESAVSYMASERLSQLDRKQRDQLFAALKNAFSIILKFLDQFSNEILADNPTRIEDCSIKHFICATIRVLGAWLSEETATMREEVYSILPFIVNVANNTFEAQKADKLQSLPGRGSSDFSEFTQEMVLTQKQSASITPDTLRFLLPALCHLVAEDRPRKIVLDLRLHETMNTYLAYHWAIFDSFKNWLKQQTVAGSVNVSEPLFMIDNSRFEMVNSKYAMTSICNILMNLTVLEPQFVEESHIFFQILKFIMSSLPNLTNDADELVLYGNFSVLGLLILKHHTRKPKATDFTVFKFIQAIVRFLWDAHNCEESLNEDELGISSNYLDHWNDLGDLWFLGMQVLNSLMPQLPWIGDFVMESGWAQEVVKTLSKVQRDGLEFSVQSAYEDFLCSIIKSSGNVINEELVKSGIIEICHIHKLKDLALIISTSKRVK